MNLLAITIILPLVGAFICLFLTDVIVLQLVALVTSLLTFCIVIYLWILFDPFQFTYQFVFSLKFSVFFDQFDFSFFRLFNIADASCLFGIDGISLVFLLLTAFLFPFCFLTNWNIIKVNVKEYLIAFLILEFLLLCVFSILDLILFYIFFESILIPMFIYIGVWGSRERKVYAAYLLFLYTLLGSLFMLLGMACLFYVSGTTDIYLLASTEWSNFFQIFGWLTFFASFAVKIPMFPFHIWLPEAHIEAPTAGSVLLAGVLLKLGGYGFLRFSLPLFPIGTEYFLPLIYTLTIIAILYTSLTILRQTDIKRIIAYSSVAHMNLIILGIFSMNLPAIESSIFLMLSHGIVSGGLFLAIGNLYADHKTRILKYYGGLVQIKPLLSSIFFILTLANMSLPGTSSFIGEFLILLGIFYQNFWVAFLAGLTVIVGACYSLWFCNRLLFGNLILFNVQFFNDISRKDFHLFFPLILFILFAGVFPDMFFQYIHNSVMLSLFSSVEESTSYFLFQC